MTQEATKRELAHLGAKAISRAFTAYHSQFKEITRRAKTRFENRDWQGMQADAAERLDLYKGVVDEIVDEIVALFGEELHERLLWARTKTIYSGRVTPLDVWELAETFFNSVTRRVFATVGVNSEIEFVDTCSRIQPYQIGYHLYRVYTRPSSTTELVEKILADFEFRVDYEDSQRDVQLVAAKIDTHLQALAADRSVKRAQMIDGVFCRGKGAYLVGRMSSGEHYIPLVLALLNTSRGIIVDAVLLTETEVSILFSFTRSYFHVDIERPLELVGFLKSIMPHKRIAELYISVGYNKHGKSELYCDLLQHLANSDDNFEIAEGEIGMVMSVFTMPSYDIVFKLIKDQFDLSKNTTRQAVMDKYNLVFKHDRAGRLIDAQEYEHLEFQRSRFCADLLEKLRGDAAQNVIINENHVVIKHSYVERRVTPLNIYLREADEASARAAVIDYGQAIKDLAATNIFPGDMLLKNFGVTRHGRVVFYDYDELCLLTDLNFRAMPQPRNYDEELSDEPWFTVADNDIFPEEFGRFLGLKGPLRDLFMQYHADVFGARFWQEIQAQVQQGSIIDIYPYEQSVRLGNANRAPSAQ